MFSIRFISGELSGQRRWIRERVGTDTIIVLPSVDGIGAGDRFTIDNRDKVAHSYYHRFIAPDDPAAISFFADGRPLYPQRPPEVMHRLAEKGRTVGISRAR